MNNFTLPKIGARNLKTALSVFLCVLLFELFHRPFPFYACIAAVICTRDTLENSLNMGKSRMIGTTIGGILGLFFIFVDRHFYINFLNTQAVITGIGIISVIYLCNILNRQSSAQIACIVYLAIMVNLKGIEPYSYAINRIFDTFIGVFIALIINIYIKPVKSEKTKHVKP